MRLGWHSRILAAALIAASCSGGSGVPDGAAPTDGGATVTDGGTLTDGGTVADGGTLDGGASDGGADRDGGALADAGVPEPQVLASGQPHPTAIAVDEAVLYFATPTEIRRVPKSGGDVVSAVGGQDRPVALAVHGDALVWVNAAGCDEGDGGTGTLLSAPRPGGTPEILASSLPCPASLVVSGGRYFVATARLAENGWQSHVLEVFPGDDPPRVVTPVNDPAAFAVAGDDLYIVGGFTVARISLSTGETEPLGSAIMGPPGTSLALDETHVYFSSGNDPGVVARVPRAGGESVELLDRSLAPIFPRVLGVEPGAVYLAFEGSLLGTPPFEERGIARVAPAGGAPRVLARVRARPPSFALDDTSLYFTDPGNGTVHRVAK
jgi:hypothetical protein